VADVLKREVQAKRKFEKLYYDCNLHSQFESLLGWLEHRTKHIQQNDSLKLLFYVRRVFFMLYDRENESAFYLMKLAKLHRKASSDVLLVNSLFR
jgi:hypothetical protein